VFAGRIRDAEQPGVESDYRRGSVSDELGTAQTSVYRGLRHLKTGIMDGFIECVLGFLSALLQITPKLCIGGISGFFGTMLSKPVIEPGLIPSLL
jgi:hypothetical protein